LNAYNAIKALMRNNLLLIIYKEPQNLAAKITFFRQLQNIGPKLKGTIERRCIVFKKYCYF